MLITLSPQNVCVHHKKTFHVSQVLGALQGVCISGRCVILPGLFGQLTTAHVIATHRKKTSLQEDLAVHIEEQYIEEKGERSKMHVPQGQLQLRKAGLLHIRVWWTDDTGRIGEDAYVLCSQCSSEGEFFLLGSSGFFLIPPMTLWSSTNLCSEYNKAY